MFKLFFVISLAVFNLANALDATSTAAVSFDFAPYNPRINENISFVVDEQTIKYPISSLKKVEWDFGDGTNKQEGFIQSHKFSKAGEYEVKATITDASDNKFKNTRSIKVEDVTIKNIIIDADLKFGNLSVSVSNRSILSIPGEVFFSIRDYQKIERNIKSIVWEFGDGNQGFGPYIRYTYFKPGVYKVFIRVLDMQNNLTDASTVITVDGASGIDLDDSLTNLVLRNARTNILPMSKDEWVIGHSESKGVKWVKEEIDKDKDSIRLVAIDRNAGETYDISKAAKVEGAYLKIQKKLLRDLNIDFTNQYKLIINSTMSNNSYYEGYFYSLFFGIGSLQITTNEPDIQLRTFTSSGHRNYFQLGNKTSLLLKDLPYGKYSISAKKEGRIRNYTIDITEEKTKKLHIDLSKVNPDEIMPENKNEQTKSQTISKFKYPEWFNKPNWQPIEDYKTRNQYPPETTNSCGMRIPLALASESLPQKVYNYTWLASPEKYSTIKGYTAGKLSSAFDVYCAIDSGYTMHSLMRWMYYDGIKECPAEKRKLGAPADSLWDDYINSVADFPNHPIAITWRIYDKITGQSNSDVYFTSLAHQMNLKGVSTKNDNDKIGIPHRSDLYMWGVEFKDQIIIPTSYLRPHLDIQIKAFSKEPVKNNYERYFVWCNIPQFIR